MSAPLNQDFLLIGMALERTGLKPVPPGISGRASLDRLVGAGFVTVNPVMDRDFIQVTPAGRVAFGIWQKKPITDVPRPKGGLTERMRRLLLALHALTERGVPPSYDELARHLGIGKTAVYRHVGLLAERGYVMRQSNRSRSLQITPGARAIMRATGMV